MSNRVNRYLMAAVVLGFIVPCSFADPPTTLTLVSAGDNYIYDPVGVQSYIGPYQVNIGSVRIVDAICIDYQNDAPTAALVGAGTPTEVTWSSSFVGSVDTTLLEQAYLAEQLLSNSYSGLSAAEIQYAIWHLSWSPALDTIAGPVQDYLPNDVPNGAPVPLGVFGTVDSTTFLGQVTYWQNQAATVVGSGGYTGSDVSLYTADTVDTQGAALQRFVTVTPGTVSITSVPEPPVLSLLGVDFSAVGVLIFALRRRIRA
ncbi:MAG: hypothetical protein LAP61_20595 [Acidobacteriia bacterium]|nr:hypothetical protein [Terriglobia bacterium]